MLGFLAGIYRVELGLDQRPHLLERLPFQLAERHRVRAATLQVRDHRQRGLRLAPRRCGSRCSIARQKRRRGCVELVLGPRQSSRGADPTPQPVRAAVADAVAIGAGARPAGLARRLATSCQVEERRPAFDTADALRVDPITPAENGCARCGHRHRSRDRCAERGGIRRQRSTPAICRAAGRMPITSIRDRAGLALVFDVLNTTCM